MPLEVLQGSGFAQEDFYESRPVRSDEAKIGSSPILVAFFKA